MLSSTSLSRVSKLRSVLAAAKAEQVRRSQLRLDKWTQYAGDPIRFVEMGLLGFLWSKQKEICQSVMTHRLTAVKSCHDVGKSLNAAVLAAYWLSCYAPGEAFVVTLAPTGHQVKAILWREINRLHKAAGLPGYTNVTEWKLDNGELVGFGRSPKDTDPTAIQGIHQRRVLVIFDEACGIAKPLWDAASSLVANEDSRMLAIGNPDDPSTEFAEVCKPGSGWNVIRISAFDSPNFTGEDVPDWLRPLLVSKTWVAERERKWGKTSPLYVSKVTGDFPEEASDGLIPLHAISAAVANTLEPGDPNELGVDVARYGEDSTVIYQRRGLVARKHEKFSKRDLMHVCGRVVLAVKQTGAKRVKIDDAGLGGGVTDRLQELYNEGHFTAEVVPINVGMKPTSDKAAEDFLNLRAELNWNLRNLFTMNLIDIDADDDLQAQAAAMKYEITSKGLIKIESKDDMKKRGVSSPDDWDALVLAFAPGSTVLQQWERMFPS